MWSCLYFKTQRFGDWIRSPSSGKTHSVGSNRQSSIKCSSIGKFVFPRLAPYGVLFFSDDDIYRNTWLVQGLIHVEHHNLKALLALTDELCCLGLYTSSWKWHRCPEMGTSSVYWTQLSRVYLRMEIESSLWNIFLKYKQDDILDKRWGDG
jgi:hypothetical protein